MTPKRIEEALRASRHTALVGFDGFVDRLLRVVKRRSGGTAEYFPTMDEFGRAVEASARRSLDLEAVLQEERMGGNAPLMASALAHLGVEATCAAALGLPEPHPAFRALEECGVRAASCGRPGLTNAYEFDDGKLMLAEMLDLESLDWQRVRDAFGLPRLTRWAEEADLLACVNWGVMPGAGDIWRGLLAEIVPRVSRRERLAFFDIANPGKRAPEELTALFGMLAGFQASYRVEIGLNESEARLAHRAYGLSGDADIGTIARELFGRIGPDALVVHPMDGAVAVTGECMVHVKGRVIEKPVLTTGGGDHFNGGWCAARLAGLGVRDALLAAIASSGCYVSTGKAADPSDIAAYIERNLQVE